MNLSGAVLSQYRRSVYDKGDVGDVERKIREFFQIKEEQAENAKKTESFNAVRGYVATSISESIYKMIRYCQLEKGIVVIDGDAGIGKTKAATKFLRDNPATAIYISTTPSTSSVRSLLRMIARALKISENQRTEDLSISIRERLRSSDNVLIIDEAQNLTPHEIKTIITRAGEGTKMVFTGDIQQIDQPYLDSQSNGLVYMIDRMRDQNLFAHVNLVKGERSQLSELASNLM